MIFGCERFGWSRGPPYRTHVAFVNALPSHLLMRLHVFCCSLEHRSPSAWHPLSYTHFWYWLGSLCDLQAPLIHRAPEVPSLAQDSADGVHTMASRRLVLIDRLIVLPNAQWAVRADNFRYMSPDMIPPTAPRLFSEGRPFQMWLGGCSEWLAE